MVLDPAHGKVYELALAHKANRPVAEGYHVNRAFTLKSSTDLVEIFAVNRERGIPSTRAGRFP